MKPKITYLAGAAVALVIAGVIFWLVAIRSRTPDPLLSVAEGFEVERVAGPPLVERPIVADFDEHGRLYVADSSGSNDKVQKQLEEKPHRIVRLEDSDGDGRFDKSVVFADKMMFPEGAMWFDGSLYVAAPPQHLETDRHQRRRHRGPARGMVSRARRSPVAPTTCTARTSGRTAGSTGARARSPSRPMNGRASQPFVTRASHIFRRPTRRRAGIEPVMTGGMDNPVDVVFTPGGERILTTTFVIQPGGGRRDGLIHAIYGGVYGKDTRASSTTTSGPATSCRS